MRSRKAKCIAGALATGLAALVVVPSAMARPDVQLLNHWFASPPSTAYCQANFGISCYNARQFENNYGTPALYTQGTTGAGQTIVIVDSFGSPTIVHDLGEFDAGNGLPAPPSFKIITPEGAPPAYDPTNGTMGGWAVETSLDVEMAHAMAPGANILLVETPVAESEGVDGFPPIEKAIQYVVDHHLGNVISQSFGATEQTFKGGAAQIKSLRYAYEDAAKNGITVLASSGDTGAGNYEPDGVDLYQFPVVGWPASDPLVTGVGGTQLHLNADGQPIAPPNVWNDTALFGSPAAGSGGLSSIFSRPSYQNSVSGVVGSARGVPDISASAAVDGGANLFISVVNGPEGLQGPGWYVVGGTSEASPLTAGIISLADQVAGHGLGLINPALYQMGDGSSSGIQDITLGNNGVTWTDTHGVTHTLAGYNAGPGYDLASGLGTPYAPTFVAQLAAIG
jgi:subtilase family serine protease